VQRRTPEADEVHERIAHAEPVDSHDPRRLLGVTQNGGVRPVVGSIGRPARATGLVGVRLETAVEADALIGQPHRPSPLVPDLRGGELGGCPVVGAWIGQPALAVVEILRLSELGAHSQVVGPPRVAGRCHGHGQQRLVHGDAESQRNRHGRRLGGPFDAAAVETGADEAKCPRDGPRRSGECSPLDEPRQRPPSAFEAPDERHTRGSLAHAGRSSTSRCITRVATMFVLQGESSSRPSEGDRGGSTNRHAEPGRPWAVGPYRRRQGRGDDAR